MSEQLSNSQDHENGTGNETANFQVVPQPEAEEEQAPSALTREAELQAKRDSDARDAEDILRRERDLEARSAIKAAVDRAVAEVSDRIITEISLTARNTVNTIEAEGLIKIEKILESLQSVYLDKQNQISGQVETFVRNAEMQIEQVIDNAKADIANRGNAMTDNLIAELSEFGTTRIGEVIALTRQQEHSAVTLRDREARAAEAAASSARELTFREEGEKVLKEAAEKLVNPEVIVEKLKGLAKRNLNLTQEIVEATSVIVQEAHLKTSKLMQNWTDRFVITQHNPTQLKPNDLIKIQHDFITETTKTVFEIYGNLFSIGPKIAHKVITK